MAAHRRYAVYYVPPPDSALARFGATWLGWDSAAGAAAHPDIPGLPQPIAMLTERPRKYGFHGTMKAPFRLAAGWTPESAQALAATALAPVAPFAAPPLKVAVLGAFVALIPAVESRALNALAAHCVTALDDLRAPATKADAARRRAGATLTPQQDALLTQWGYPYVLAEFHFHMTLTGPLPPDQAALVCAALEPILAPLLADPPPVMDLCWMGEDADGMFHQINRLPLSG